jgi:hypothetical protein
MRLFQIKPTTAVLVKLRAFGYPEGVRCISTDDYRWIAGERRRRLLLPVTRFNDARESEVWLGDRDIEDPISTS